MLMNKNDKRNKKEINWAIAYTIHSLNYASSNKQHKKVIAISKSNRLLFDYGKAINLQ